MAVDGVSIGALIIALISALVLFLKSIKKCKCDSSGVYMEREINMENGGNMGTSGQTQTQQDFTLKLIQALKNSTPRSNSNKQPVCEIEMVKMGDSIQPQSQPQPQLELSEEVIRELVNQYKIKPKKNNKPIITFRKPTSKKGDITYMTSPPVSEVASSESSSNCNTNITSFIAKKPQ